MNHEENQKLLKLYRKYFQSVLLKLRATVPSLPSSLEDVPFRESGGGYVDRLSGSLPSSCCRHKSLASRRRLHNQLAPAP